jgi:hypothetical protein
MKPTTEAKSHDTTLLVEYNSAIDALDKTIFMPDIICLFHHGFKGNLLASPVLHCTGLLGFEKVDEESDPTEACLWPEYRETESVGFSTRSKYVFL